MSKMAFESVLQRLADTPCGDWTDRDWMLYQRMLFSIEGYAPVAVYKYTAPLKNMGGDLFLSEDALEGPAYKRMATSLPQAKALFEKRPLEEPPARLMDPQAMMWTVEREEEKKATLDALSFNRIKESVYVIAGVYAAAFEQAADEDASEEERTNSNNMVKLLDSMTVQYIQAANPEYVPGAEKSPLEMENPASTMAFSEWLSSADYAEYRKQIKDALRAAAEEQGVDATPLDEIEWLWTAFKGMTGNDEYQRLVHENIVADISTYNQMVKEDSSLAPHEVYGVLFPELVDAVWSDRPLLVWLEQQGYLAIASEKSLRQEIAKIVGDWAAAVVGNPESDFEFHDEAFAAESVAELSDEDFTRTETIISDITDNVLARVLADARKTGADPEAIVQKGLTQYIPVFREQYTISLQQFDEKVLEPIDDPAFTALVDKVFKEWDDVFIERRDAAQFVAKHFRDFMTQAEVLGYDDIGTFANSKAFMGMVFDVVPPPFGVPVERVRQDIQSSIMQRFGLSRTDLTVPEVADLVESFYEMASEMVIDPRDPKAYAALELPEETMQFYQNQIEMYRPAMTEVEKTIGKAMVGLSPGSWRVTLDAYKDYSAAYFNAKNFSGYEGSFDEYVASKGLREELATNLVMAEKAVNEAVIMYQGSAEFLERYGGDAVWDYTPIRPWEGEPKSAEEKWGMAETIAEFDVEERLFLPLREVNMGRLRSMVSSRMNQVYGMAQTAGTEMQKYLTMHGFAPSEQRAVGIYAEDFISEYTRKAMAAASDVAVDDFTGEILYRAKIPTMKSFLEEKGLETFKALVPYERTPQLFRRQEL